jgi:hypothetical protein
MALTITENRITSDEVTAVAQRWENTREQVELGGPEFYWTVTDLGDALDRNQAISAMTLAEELARPEPNRRLIESLRSELR